MALTGYTSHFGFTGCDFGGRLVLGGLCRMVKNFDPEFWEGKLCQMIPTNGAFSGFVFILLNLERDPPKREVYNACQNLAVTCLAA
jgi:hypothetical protein